MNKIMLISGPVRTGKTSRLSAWLKNQKDADGILAPLYNNEKYLLHIRTNEKRALEIHGEVNNVITIGRYKFDPVVFDWAKGKLIEALHNNPGYIVIDEIGPLELDGKGFEPIAGNILNSRHWLKNIIIVVRSNILEQFLSHYQLKPDEVEFMNL